MNSSGPGREAERKSIWPFVAAAILLLQGVNTILYAGILPPVISDAGVTLPFLGHLPFVWITAGGLDIAAAIGVWRRRTWGRYLGIVSAIVTIAAALTTASSLPLAAVSLVLPLLVLFALWQRWPAGRTT